MEKDTKSSHSVSEEAQSRYEKGVLSSEERALVRKIDWRLLPLLGLMYTLSYIDRVNIGLARLYGLETDLKLSSNEYAISLSIFFLGYMSFEIPSNFMLKRLSPPVWFGVILLAWGGTTMAMAATINFVGLVLTRIFLGMFEAGLFPGIIFCLSYWYPRHEQGSRIAILCSATSVAGSLGGLIAYAIHNMDNVGGLESWRWLFILEGLPTVLLGATIWFILPSSPQDAKFLSPNERALLVQRLEASHVDLNIKRFDWNEAKKVAKDPMLYLFMLLNFGVLLPGNVMGLLLPTLVNGLGFDPVISTVLTVPPNLFGAIVSIVMAWHSDRKVERGFHLILSISFAIIGFIILQTGTNTILQYFSLMLINAGTSSSISLILSWLNNNLMGSTIAAIAPPAVIMAGSVGGILAGQLYKSTDAPHFYLSHNLNIGSLVLSVVCVIVLRWIMTRANRRTNMVKDLNNWSNTEEQQNTFRFIL